MSEEGIHWLEHKQITDESKGGAGFISKVSADGGAVRVVWQHTIGGEKGGVFHPDGWESGMPRHFKLFKRIATPTPLSYYTVFQE